MHIFNTRYYSQMNLRFTFLLFILISTILPIVAQNVIQVSGYVLHKDSLGVTPIAAKIMNNKTRTGTIANADGFYIITVGMGDTIEVSALGYETMKVAVPNNIELGSYYYDVKMNRKAIILKDVNYSLLNYDRFKKEFTEMVKVDTFSRLQVSDPSIYKNYTPYNPNFGIRFSPFSFFHNKFGARAKEMSKLQDLLENKNTDVAAAQNYTKGLIQEVTNIPDEEVDEFVKYCNISSEFAANATKYDLMVAIDRCYTNYKKVKNILPVEE